MKRKVNAIWNGNGADGKGYLTTQSGAIENMPYNFKSRFENEDGRLGTNPEELIASALSGCFNMKLAFVLNEEDYEPEKLETNALLSFEDGAITNIHLELMGLVPNIEESNFKKLAEVARENCPISGALNCRITLNASLVR
tara:strand:+ start:584 stop:1006 length:423 start_codon:yes stop_codon:yes gene_type:complete